MPTATMNTTATFWRPRLMDELESPKVPFPPVEAYVEDVPVDEASVALAFLTVRDSLDNHLWDLLESVRAMRYREATQEDVRRLAQVRTVILGALETLKP